ncbi:glycosyltransferase family 4 protein [Halomicrobium sp. IBSBa]|uniref:glycosyltransferase family 4 protein n=1 Tax=Halomicrobium sp. IBSBa TaxID=2778916 RepID=UPI001ABF711F|nr:glycosyltransferase family 4 protein [Halomicrobium sp. IBSBa]MBO4248891.1 glycosyltransferase family 4 protein [Halomicrobium sp. IBSBa]
MSGEYRLLACSRAHPSAINPYKGLFNRRSLSSLAQYCPVDLDVIAPVPRAPPIGPYSNYRNMPSVEYSREYEVHHPRFFYPLPKRLFKYTVASKSFTRSVTNYANDTLAIPDIIHAGHIYFDGYGVLQYCKQHDIPLTVMGRGHLLNNYNSLPRSAKKKVNKTLDYCSRVCCVSEALSDIARDLTDEKKVTLLAEGTDPNRYPTGNAESIRHELDIPEENAVVLFVGSFNKNKGIKEITEILPTLEIADLTVVFVGHHGDLRWEVERAMNQSSVDVRSYWKLSPLALRRLYAVADLLLLPSYSEGRPSVIYEAMASETAVFASDIGGIREQVANGTTGTLIPPGDPETLRERLTAMVSDRDSLAEMGKAGLDRLQENGWTWKRHAEQLYDIHRSIIETDDHSTSG